MQGAPIADAIRSTGVTEVTCYRWRNEPGGLKSEQVKRRKDRETESARLRKAISDLILDKPILQEPARIRESGQSFRKMPSGHTIAGLRTHQLVAAADRQCLVDNGAAAAACLLPRSGKQRMRSRTHPDTDQVWEKPGKALTIQWAIYPGLETISP